MWEIMGVSSNIYEKSKCEKVGIAIHLQKRAL